MQGWNGVATDNSELTESELTKQYKSKQIEKAISSRGLQAVQRQPLLGLSLFFLFVCQSKYGRLSRGGAPRRPACIKTSDRKYLICELLTDYSSLEI